MSNDDGLYSYIQCQGDADIAIWADESVEFLNQMGVIIGFEDNTLKLIGSINRTETVLMMSKDVESTLALITK